jgi:hypothetical protein
LYRFQFKLEEESMATYIIVKVKNDLQAPKVAQDIELDWNAPQWKDISIITIDNFLAESSEHRPVTQLKLQYSEDGIFGLFNAQDNYVLCQQSQFQDMVCKDSCVEMFIQPTPDSIPAGQPHATYMNLEVSGNGTKLCYSINDATRTEGGFVDFSKLTNDDGLKIITRSTLPEGVFPEITKPTTWQLGFYLPFSLIKKYTGLTANAVLSGSTWRMNAFKCSEDSSHPHWASWKKCSAFNFHQPDDFGFLIFE